MDYEKKIKNALSDKSVPFEVQAWLEEQFPELKENEDERIRKALLEHIKGIESWEYFLGISKEQMIAWLEKQGEQEEHQVYETEDGEIITYSETDGYKVVEPKFKVGDWVVSNEHTNCVNSLMRIIKVGLTNYLCQYYNGQTTYCHEFIDKSYHLWSIDDAKDGDVLVHSSFMFDDFVFIYNNTSILQAYCYYSNEKKRFIIEDRGHYCPWNMQEVKPATKEQRDLLFAKMAEVGYKWDAEKKELKKIMED